MRRSTEYAIVVVFVFAYMSAFIAAYYFLGNDEGRLNIALTIISMAIMGVTMVLSVIFLQINRRDEIREYDEERRKRKEEGQS